MDVRKRIRELRKRYKIGQYKLARLADIGQSNL